MGQTPGSSRRDLRQRMELSPRVAAWAPAFWVTLACLMVPSQVRSRAAEWSPPPADPGDPSRPPGPLSSEAASSCVPSGPRAGRDNEAMVKDRQRGCCLVPWGRTSPGEHGVPRPLTVVGSGRLRSRGCCRGGAVLMPRIPPTSAKWYLYEISRTRLHRAGAKKKKKKNFQILSIIGKLTFGKYFPTPAPGRRRMDALCRAGAAA